MALVDVTIPPGMFLNGTKYQGMQRYVKGNLMRSLTNGVATIGGWRRAYDFDGETDIPALFANAGIEAPRNMITWRTNGGVIYTAVGTNRALYVVDYLGNITDITPTGFTTVSKDGGYTSNGYGTGPYGVETYGTPRSFILPQSDFIQTWCFDIWGENLLAMITGPNQPIYQWEIGDPEAVALSNAPTNARSFVVTDQRILFTIGDTSNIRAITWSDSENNNDFTPAEDNQAGDKTQPGRGNMVRAINVGKDTLIITESDVHIARYIGPPYIFNISKVAENIDIIGHNAVALAGSNVFWWGQETFWVYANGVVQPLPCEVIDYLSQAIDREFRSKTTCFVQTAFKEVWWFYQSIYSTTEEPDSYVIYNYETGAWMLGSLDRVAGSERTQWSSSLMITHDGLLYIHELPTIPTDPDNTFIETGAFSLNGGERLAYIGRAHIDVSRYRLTDGSENASSQAPVIDTQAAGVQVMVIVKDDQTGAEREFGPYDPTFPIPIRASGRYIKLRFYGGDQLWRLGVQKLEFMTPDGGARR